MANRYKVDIEEVLVRQGIARLAYAIDELESATPFSRAFWYSVIESGELTAIKGREKTVVLFWDLIDFFNRLPSYTAAPGKAERTKQAADLRARRGKKSVALSVSPEGHG